MGEEKYLSRRRIFHIGLSITYYYHEE